MTRTFSFEEAERLRRRRRSPRGCGSVTLAALLRTGSELRGHAAASSSRTRNSSSVWTDERLILADEVLTPDSSRFWPADRYESGRGQPSFDKQYVRDYLESIGWNKEPPVPGLPDEIVQGTRGRYLEIFEILSGRRLR